MNRDPADIEVELSTRLGRLMEDLLFQADKPDLLNFVLRAHLHIERALRGIVAYGSAHPASRLRLNYQAALDVSVAFGLLRASLVDPLEYVRELRNGLAHIEAFQLDRSKQSTLFDRLEPADRDRVVMIEGLLEGSEFPHRLKYTISHLYAEVTQCFMIAKARVDGVDPDEVEF